jgi:NAD dependent epimerase/dehydratase family
MVFRLEIGTPIVPVPGRWSLRIISRRLIMTILVTGSAGVIGTQVLEQLKGSGAAVHALTRRPDQAHFPSDVTPVKGDLRISTRRAAR